MAAETNPESCRKFMGGTEAEEDRHWDFAVILSLAAERRLPMKHRSFRLPANDGPNGND
jgi:hypothetical protein